MEISQKARNDLREVLITDIGPKATSEMTEEDLDHIGMFLLTVLMEGAKLRTRDGK